MRPGLLAGRGLSLMAFCASKHGMKPAVQSCLAWIVFCLFNTAFQAGAADASWKAGFAAVKITPTEALLLSGYSSRTNGA